MRSTTGRGEAFLRELGRQEVVPVVVGGHELASERKRRRIGRATLVERCDRCDGTTWLPGDPTTVPASLLVLAAMSLAQRKA